MTRAFALALALLALGAAGASKVTCRNCPVKSVDPKATIPFAHADVSAGCTPRLSHGFPVPDPKCTPGAFNPTLTLNVLQNKAFTTDCIRDCVTSDAVKKAAYKFYRIPRPLENQGQAQTCELDHLVSLELGGADSLDNIWPQCGPATVTLPNRFFKLKDEVENYLAKQVRAGTISLADAQTGIALDWTQYLEVATGFCTKNPLKCSP